MNQYIRDQRRRDEASQLLNFFTKPYGYDWRPTLDADGRPVPHAGANVEITAELIAALGREADVLGTGTVVPHEVAEDVALCLRGQAVVAKAEVPR
jgi:hypothetical protein